jgi:protein-disulfide isomerase
MIKFPQFDSKIASGLPKKKWYKKWWMIVLMAVILLTLIFGIMTLVQYIKITKGLSTNAPAANQREWYTSDELLKDAQNDPTWGDKKAPIQIVEFADFECPYCRENFTTVREIMLKYPDKIYFVFRDFPLTEVHPHAEIAAESAHCVNEQGKFWAYHDKLFTNQENLDTASLKNYAREVGADLTKYSQCLASGKYKAIIASDYENGLKLQVAGTPTFFVNGFKVSGIIPRDKFFMIIDQALK